MRLLWVAVIGLPSWIFRVIVRGYQICISPLLGPRCRFTPTCSEYFILSVEKYGAMRGGVRGVRRICRCHPWNSGGHDPP
ncbi:MAG: membrane protein insertion efficiency factor YidD [Pirellulales bacterium]